MSQISASGTASARLVKELQRIQKCPPTSISFYQREEEKNIIDVVLVGEEGTPYEGGLFKLIVTIPDRYPFEPPHVKFVTPVYHPNIDDAGLICLDLLKCPPAGSWRPVLNIGVVLTTIRLLMANPNPADPLMPEIANEFLYNKALYEDKARCYTNKHAVGQCVMALKKKS